MSVSVILYNINITRMCLIENKFATVGEGIARARRKTSGPDDALNHRRSFF